MDWENLEPDRYKLMNKHYTPGRGGAKIECIVIHHNAGVLSIDDIWNVWQDREASAHYQVTSSGEIGQLVNDADTAWHAANQYTNQRSIGIEISNSGGPDQDWPVADAAIESAAHLVAAVCKYYDLGRPVSGDNIRYHKEFWGTSCPYHLAPGGKYNQRLISRAQEWYDEMAGAKKAAAKPVAAAKPKGGLVALSDAEQHELLDKVREIHHEMTFQFNSRYDEDAKWAGIETDIYRDTMVGFLLELDRKCEDIHRNMIPAIYKALEGDK